MNSMELLNKYAELNAQAMEKSELLNIYNNQMFNVESPMSEEEYKHLVNETNKEIFELEANAKKAYEQYLTMAREEAKKRAAESLGFNESVSMKK